jgi:molybdopterin converting factor small subunit
MAKVHLDGMLRAYVPRTQLTSPAGTLEGLLDDLEGRFPMLQHRIRNEVRDVRPFVRIFVNGTAVTGPSALRTKLGASDVVDILHSIQGG